MITNNNNNNNNVINLLEEEEDIFVYENETNDVKRMKKEPNIF